ncbi:hypothetical protein [Streptomyces tubercidicus]|uniref:Uncharacterized protein n=1 Tax=Streptomyces tubercidicus TaxID=47759 RepID=A0A640UPB6_9ACTN|nr:hypothetical protein [Streptomyces tubercidicus]WAU11297.1 hypothetical protein STRTU_001492 [Streptomyces tubercidicus]GFE36541.1 hypothetical protein Stube_12140 [Streptomyces tubercidicus]
MSDQGQPVTCSPECLSRAQHAVATALWHYTNTPLAKPYYVRGCIPDPDDEAAVIVALWTGPTARDKRNLFFFVRLMSGELPVPAARVASGMMRLSRGTHIFGFAGRHFDGKRVLQGSKLVKGRPAPCLCTNTGEPEGPRGFYFERPGQLKQYH